MWHENTAFRLDMTSKRQTMTRAGDRVTTTKKKTKKTNPFVLQVVCFWGQVVHLVWNNASADMRSQCLDILATEDKKKKKAEDKRTCKENVKIKSKSDLHQKGAANISPFYPTAWATLLFLKVSLRRVIVCLGWWAPLRKISITQVCLDWVDGSASSFFGALPTRYPVRLDNKYWILRTTIEQHSSKLALL